MSIQITRRVWKLSLPSTAKIVLLCLADHADETGRCWPSIPTIAERAGLKTRAVQMALKGLEDRGLIAREERRGRGVIYTLNLRTKCTPSEGQTPASDAPPHEMQAPPHEMRNTPALNAPTPALDAPKPPITTNEPTNQPNAVFARVCRAAGWHPPTEAKAAAARADLQCWIETGYDLDRDIIPGIARAIAERPRERTSPLRRFTTTIADEARNAHQPNANGSAPQTPLPEADQGDDRIAQLRSDIRGQLGPTIYDSWLAPGRTALAINGTGLIIKARKGFNEDWIRQNFGDAITARAQALGLKGARIVGI